MPLKSPDEIPKIPKSRKKKIENAVKAIPSKKPDKVEYSCTLYFDANKNEKISKTIIKLETEIEFSTFLYEINTEIEKEQNVVTILLAGLSAKSDSIPSVKPAQSFIEIDKLIGEVEVIIYRQDGAVNKGVYKLNSLNSSIKILSSSVIEKENNRRFCDFKVEE